MAPQLTALAPGVDSLHALGCATLATSWGWLSTHLTAPHARDEPPSRAGPSGRLRCGHEARSADPCGVLPPPTSTLLLCSQVSEGSNGTVDVTNFHTSWQVCLVRPCYHLTTLHLTTSPPYHLTTHHLTTVHTPWQNGMAFNALINAFRPDLLKFEELKATNKLDNLNQVPTHHARPPYNSLPCLRWRAPLIHRDPPVIPPVIPP